MKKTVATLLFLVIVLFNTVILKPTTTGRENENLQVPDITFAYDGQAVYENFFLKLAPGKIPAYKKMMLWDYVYPVIYTAFLFLMGQLLITHALFKRVFITAVFAAFLFDYAENLTQLYLLNELPATHIGLGTVMGMFTTLKWVTALFALFSVITVLVQAGIKKMVAARQ